jgi:hypothetical protein
MDTNRAKSGFTSFLLASFFNHVAPTHWITHSCYTLIPTSISTVITVTNIYIYIYMCVCVCVCARVRVRARRLSSYFCFLHSEDGD